MTRLLLALTVLVPLPALAVPIFETSGVFLWDPSLGDQTTAEAVGNVSGLGTSTATVGTGIRGSGPTRLSFEGFTDVGSLPSEPFRVGTLTVFNGDITFPGPPAVTSLTLQVDGAECDSGDPFCPSTAGGAALLAFVFTANVDASGAPLPPEQAADSVCIDVVSGGEQCAWQLELTSMSFDIIARFGSLEVVDLIPTTPGAFVTAGRNPTENVLRRVPVQEPGTMALLGAGMVALMLRRKWRSAGARHVESTSKPRP